MSADGKGSSGPAAAAGGVSHDSHKIAKSRMRVAEDMLSDAQVGRIKQELADATGKHPGGVSFHRLEGINIWREPTDPRKSKYAESEEEKVAFHGHPSQTRPGSLTPRSAELERADAAIDDGKAGPVFRHLLNAISIHNRTGGADWPAPAETRAAAAKGGSGTSPAPGPDGKPTSAALPSSGGAKAAPLAPDGKPNTAALPDSAGGSAAPLSARGGSGTSGRGSKASSGTPMPAASFRGRGGGGDVGGRGGGGSRGGGRASGGSHSGGSSGRGGGAPKSSAKPPSG